MSMEFFEHSVFFGVSLSLLAYGLGVVLQKRFRLALFNTLLLSDIVTILVLVNEHKDYEPVSSRACSPRCAACWH